MSYIDVTLHPARLFVDQTGKVCHGDCLDKVNGYVYLPKDHPWSKCFINNGYDAISRHFDLDGVELTFGALQKRDGVDVVALGFDTGHLYDIERILKWMGLVERDGSLKGELKMSDVYSTLEWKNARLKYANDLLSRLRTAAWHCCPPPS